MSGNSEFRDVLARTLSGPGGPHPLDVADADDILATDEMQAIKKALEWAALDVHCD